MSCVWEELKKGAKFDSTPIVINDNELLVAESRDDYSDGALYKYIINDNEWIRYLNYPNDFDTNYHSTAYDKEKNIVTGVKYDEIIRV